MNRAKFLDSSSRRDPPIFCKPLIEITGLQNINRVKQTLFKRYWEALIEFNWYENSDIEKSILEKKVFRKELKLNTQITGRLNLIPVETERLDTIPIITPSRLNYSVRQQKKGPHLRIRCAPPNRRRGATRGCFIQWHTSKIFHIKSW